MGPRRPEQGVRIRVPPRPEPEARAGLPLLGAPRPAVCVGKSLNPTERVTDASRADPMGAWRPGDFQGCVRCSAPRPEVLGCFLFVEVREGRALLRGAGRPRRGRSRVLGFGAQGRELVSSS